jgi:hypothetical protein
LRLEGDSAHLEINQLLTELKVANLDQQDDLINPTSDSVFNVIR